MARTLSKISLLLLVLLVASDVSLPPVQVDELPITITRIQ